MRTAHVGIEPRHILEPEQQRWPEEQVEIKHVKPPVAEQKYILSKLNAAEAFETFLQTKYVGRNGSHSKARRRPSDDGRGHRPQRRPA